MESTLECGSGYTDYSGGPGTKRARSLISQCYWEDYIPAYMLYAKHWYSAWNIADAKKITSYSDADVYNKRRIYTVL